MSSPLRALCLAGSKPTGGSTVAAALDAISVGSLPNIEFVTLVTGNRDAGVCRIALERGMDERDIVVLPPDRYRGAELERALHDVCDRFDVNFIWQSGWTRLTPKGIVERFRGRIINQHGGGLNPGKFVDGKHVDFGGSGMKGRATFAAELYYAHSTGRTHGWAVAHHVDEGLDTGRVIRSWRVPIFKSDTVESYATRKGPIEKAVQIATLGDFACHGRVTTIEPEGIAVTLAEMQLLWDARARGIAEFPQG